MAAFDLSALGAALGAPLVDGMEGNADTVTLLALRAMVLGRVAVPAGIAPVIEACRAAREEYAALSPAAPATSCVAVLRGVWRALARLREGHPLYVPPIYTNAALEALLCDLVGKVRRRETCVPQPWTSDHAVVGGVEGTGKSTLLKALACGVAVCSPAYLLALADFSAVPLATWRLPEFFVELALRYTYDDFSGAFGTLGARADGNTAGDAFRRMMGDEARGGDEPSAAAWALLRAPHTAVSCAPPPLRIGLCCDEVQLLFVDGAPLDDPRVRTLQQLQTFARSVPAALLCLTGSSADLQTRLFAHARDGQFTAYADFNKSLCDIFAVPALRTQADLAAYLAARYPGTAHGDVAQLLHTTGGIGRLVHAAVAGTAVARRMTPEENVASGGRDGVAMLVQRMVHIEAAGGPLHATAVAASPDAVLLTPQDVSIARMTALQELESAGFARDAAVVRLQRWADTGLVYHTIGSADVSLARPRDAHAYLVGCTSEDYRRVREVCAMLFPADAGRATCAGFALEDLVLARVHRLPLPSSWGWRRHEGGVLKYRDGSFTWAPRADAPFAVVTRAALMDALRGRVMRWRLESGLDGVIIEARESDAGVTAVLNGWQCKGGAVSAELCGGDPDTYRARILAGADFDATKYVASIVVKAEVGFAKLSAALLGVPGVIAVELGQLLITSTKEDVRKARIALDEWSGEQALPVAIAAKFGVDAAGAARCSFKYKIALCAEKKWLYDLLEQPLCGAYF